MLSLPRRQFYCLPHQVVRVTLSNMEFKSGTSRTLLLACSTHLCANIRTAAFFVLGSRSRNPHRRIRSRLPILRILKSPISFILREYTHRRLIASMSLARSMMNRIVALVCSRLKRTARRTSLSLEECMWEEVRARIVLQKFDKCFRDTNPFLIVTGLESCQGNDSLNTNRGLSISSSLAKPIS
jgi:hypothetical protein